ncbi:Hsp70 family protein [uncultured Arcticibacterium sp.]|uniref:Hsp70 family protein n=1 Tax=uncultured Arcticibacterium sp. TaxID=2173042 RepID=UPI0030FB8F11
MSNFIYGVDFGTTNSALAILDLEKNEVVKVFTMPSVLFFPDLEHGFAFSTGQEAIDNYVKSKSNGRLMKSIKSVLPIKSFTHTVISNKVFKSEDLVALVMKALKKQADDFLGEEVKTAVIGRPVVFSENAEKEAIAQKRLENAVKLSGFETVSYQMEPIAAAYTYERTLKKKELVLVADFGGGTSDFTLMELGANKTHDNIVQGGIYIGGDNFDSKLMWHKGTPHFGRGVKEKFFEKWVPLPLSYFVNITTWAKMNFLNTNKMREAIRKSYFRSGDNPKVKNLLTLIEKNLGYELFQHVEKAKIELTKNDTTDFAFSNEEIDFKEPVSAKEFEEEIIEEELQKIGNYLDEFLAKNNASYEDIDSIFMTGGTSMVRGLRNLFTARFGASKIKSGDNFNSVAMGLAYSYKK